MKNSITWSLNFTVSKIAGLACILAGFIMIFMKEAGNGVIVMGIGSGLIGVKTYVTGMEK